MTICSQECFWLSLQDSSLILYLFTRMLLTFFTGFVFDMVFVHKNALDFLNRICLMWYLFTRMHLTFLTGFVWCGICLQECFYLLLQDLSWLMQALMCGWATLGETPTPDVTSGCLLKKMHSGNGGIHVKTITLWCWHSFKL